MGKIWEVARNYGGILVSAGALAVGRRVVRSEEPAPPPAPTIREQLAPQTALLERIVAVLEWWEAEGNAAKAAAEERNRRVMQGWRPGETHGRKELPNTLERPR